MKTALAVSVLLSACTTAHPTPGARSVPTPLPPLGAAPEAWPGHVVHHEATPAAGPIRAMWTTAPDDVWAIGGEHTVMHWDGHAWLLSLPTHCEREGCATPIAIWAAGRDDAWLAGTHAGYDSPPDGDLIEHLPATTVLQHWDGRAWTVVRPPDLGDHVVTQIHGSSGRDVWFTTSATSIEDRHPNPVAVLLHWDGKQLKRVQFVGADSVDDIWARAPDDAWATSFHAVWHWDGSEWTLAGKLDYPRAVWGDAKGVNVVVPSGEVFHTASPGTGWTSIAPAFLTGKERVAGIWRGAAETIRGGGIMYRWRGNHWDRLALPAMDVQAATDAWVLGERDGARAVAHDEGGTWSLLAEPTSDLVTRMSFTAATDGWAVAAGQGRGALLRWDGRSWLPAAAQPPLRARTVLAIDARHVWVASETELALWDGAHWQLTPSAGASDLSSLWASTADDVWAAGCGGSVLHWDGKTWRPQRVDIPKTSVGVCMALGGSGPADLWAVGILGNYFHWDGKAWTRVRLDLLTERVYGVWAAAPDDVWLVGAQSNLASDIGPLLEHWDGKTWTHVRTDRAAPALFRIWGRAHDDIWATGERGTLVHFDGTRWACIAVSSTGADDRDLWALGGGHTGPVWVGGADGALISLSPP